ncbi:MAG: dUTP diphosphatase [Cellvibrionaceae bacterium]|nr:dUTP diphosphatase [Cellvibrionaceae bacterium]
MYNEIITMLELQQEMNAKVHPQWREQGFQWHRAIWVECAELLEHYGWKWWKKQNADRNQVNLELVDIWHFGISELLQSSNSHEAICELIQKGFEDTVPQADFREAVEQFVADTLNRKTFYVASFASVMAAADLSFDELYRQYLGKNVLNLFRQNHGYKDGSYQKIWQGKEDNEHLVEAVEQLGLNAPDARNMLYRELQRRYPGN